MLPVYVAVVPSEEDPSSYETGEPDAIPFQQDLFHVCAALQTQVTRDLAPLWGISAVVSPFVSLDHVPIGYIPIVIVPPGALGPDTRIGFHMEKHTKPFALVEYGVGWSLLASHELLEIIVDPSGGRTVRGTSIVDVKNLAPRPHAAPDYDDQGEVDYLLEICDPCQWSTYTINGVLVSDFVTPQYHDPVETAGARYCFTGRLTGPRQLLDGGYITWATPENGSAWQAFAPATLAAEPSVTNFAALSVIELGTPSSFSRDWVDSTVAPDRPGVENALDPSEPLLTPAEESYVKAMGSSKEHGQSWRKIVKRFVEPPTVPVDDKVLALLDKLAKSDALRDEFDTDPQTVIVRELEIDLPEGSVLRTWDVLPPKARYKAVREGLRQGKRLGPDFHHGHLPVGGFGLIRPQKPPGG